MDVIVRDYMRDSRANHFASKYGYYRAVKYYAISRLLYIH